MDGGYNSIIECHLSFEELAKEQANFLVITVRLKLSGDYIMDMKATISEHGLTLPPKRPSLKSYKQ